MKKNHTEIAVVLDKSGSMGSCVNDTIGGFNTFLEDQKKVQGTANFTLMQFDTNYHIIHDGIDIQNAKFLDNKNYNPSGMTALHDAVGRTINSIGQRLDKMPDHEKPEHVIIVIITDGEENSSVEFQKDNIASMIKHQQEKYNWKFTFLGADIDAWDIARSLNIDSNVTMKFAKNKKGISDAYCSVSSNMAQMRSGAKADMSYSQEDYDKQKDAGV